MIHNGHVVVFLSSSITKCCLMMGSLPWSFPKKDLQLLSKVVCFVFVVLRTIDSHIEHGWSCSYPFLKGFSLFFVDCLHLFFLWVAFTCAFTCLVLLMDGFPSLIFIYMVFLSQELIKIRSHNKHSRIVDPSYGRY